MLITIAGVGQHDRSRYLLKGGVVRGDKLVIKEHHTTIAKQLFDMLTKEIVGKYTISVGGESGAGKSGKPCARFMLPGCSSATRVISRMMLSVNCSVIFDKSI